MPAAKKQTPRINTAPKLTRREFCSTTVAATAGFSALAPVGSVNEDDPPTAGNRGASFLNILRPPDLVIAFTSRGKVNLVLTGADQWEGDSVTVGTVVKAGVVGVSLHSPVAAVTRLLFRWRGGLAGVRMFLGDQWERSYADLCWQGEMPNRTMPWYFLGFDGKKTHGYGVKTQPGAFCFWNADLEGISLWADVRNGGSGVELGERTLHVCDIVCRQGHENESPFAAAVALCRVLCPKPLLPAAPVYGTNDWYYAYGHSDPDAILKVTEAIVALAPKGPIRPYSVVDAGWSPGGSDRGPWDRAIEKFGSMSDFASRLRSAGAEPGIWVRPLASASDAPESWRLSRDKTYLDPTIPDVISLIQSNLKRYREWGYGMIKHDYTSFDIMGRWGFDMGARITNDGWTFNDRTRTSAEIIRTLYSAIREAAGMAMVIGCNTFSHLSAGMFELNRIGDDTSGRAWDRTRRMGVNTLAFRAPQHRTFYAADPDCVPITNDVPWDLTQKWLELVAAGGMPLLVSPQLDGLGPEQRSALARAFEIAAGSPPTAEPLDWLTTSIPRRWKLRGRNVSFDWMGPVGPWPFGD
jgi:alpha-galactosidase